MGTEAGCQTLFGSVLPQRSHSPLKENKIEKSKPKRIFEFLKGYSINQVVYNLEN